MKRLPSLLSSLKADFRQETRRYCKSLSWRHNKLSGFWCVACRTLLYCFPVVFQDTTFTNVPVQQIILEIFLVQQIFQQRIWSTLRIFQNEFQGKTWNIRYKSGSLEKAGPLVMTNFWPTLLKTNISHQRFKMKLNFPSYPLDGKPLVPWGTVQPFQTHLSPGVSPSPTLVRTAQLFHEGPQHC